MKILIIGAQGMLGHDLAKVLSGYDLVLWDKSDLDITNQQQVDLKITELKTDAIINCAAYTAVDDCEIKKELAMAVNGYAVGYLAEVANKSKAILIHISTDYVFNGLNENGYNENSQEFGPINEYGQSKYFGEQELLKKCAKYYLIRTSWLYGADGPNFVDTMIHLGKEKDELKVINDQFGKPTYTVDLARQIRYILDKQLAYGIYHVTNESVGSGISWYEFACKIFELAGLEVEVKPCSSTELIRPALRPAFSVLINTKLPPVRLWADALKEYLNSKI